MNWTLTIIIYQAAAIICSFPLTAIYKGEPWKGLVAALFWPVVLLTAIFLWPFQRKKQVPQEPNS